MRLPSLELSAFKARVLVEGLGSFVYVLTIVLAEANCGKAAINGVTVTRNFAPMAVGFMLTALMFSFAYISGGHFNPAVTFGALMARSMRIELAVAYVAAQCVCGIAGGIVGLFLIWDANLIPVPQVYNNLPEYVFRGFGSEAIFTGVLVTVVLHSAYSRQRTSHFYGLAVGLCVMSCYYAVGGISNGAFNPAVATSLQLVKCVTGNCIPMMHLWLYWSAPACGALGASILFKMAHPEPVKPPVIEAEQTVY